MHDRATERWSVGWSATAKTATLNVGQEPIGSPMEATHVGYLGLPEIKFLQSKAASEGCHQLMLAGDEPTLRRDLGAIIRAGSKRGLFVGIRTDGRRFSIPGYAEKMAGSGLRYAEVLIGHICEVDDLREEGEQRFEQVCSGVDALIDVGVEVVACYSLADESTPALDPFFVFASKRDTLTILFESNGQDVELPSHTAMLDRAKNHGVRFRVTRRVGANLENEAGGLELEQRPIQSFRGVPILSENRDKRLPEMGRLDTGPRYPDTALITLIVAGCDLNCIFCETPQADIPPETSTLASVKSALEAMRRTTTGVYFTGGEPSSVPWIFEAIEYAKALGYDRIQMQSHAGRAADLAYAKRLVQAGLTAIDVPFYGPNARVHEEITKTPHSFDRTKCGLENLQALGVRICVHATLFQTNLESVRELIQLWDVVKPDAAYLQTSGEVGQPGTYARVAPSPRAVGATIQEALRHEQPDYPLYVTDVAACHMPAEQHRILRWQTPTEFQSQCLVMPYSDWLMTFTGGRARTKGLNCQECRFEDSCDGIAHEALELFGEGELIPQ